jgi:CubicO group peptidase (beta-lactamase class C family)
MDLDAFSSATRRLMAEHQVPGLSIAVTSSSRLIYAGAFGNADLAQHRATTSDTRFLWFSMSKIVTATAALRLADEGRLDLDAPVRSVVPSFAAKSGHIEPQIRQLLNHTAGAANPLPLRWVQPAGAPPGVARDKVGTLLRRARPRRPVGELARYSNLGYLVLADVIAAAAGEPFEKYARRAVLDPVGMLTTGFEHDPAADSATGYVRLPRPLTPLLRAALPAGIVGERHERQLALHPFTVIGAGYGGLIGDAPDAARLLRMHLADGIIDGQRILATDTARSMRVVRTPGKPFDLGLGWFRRPADRHARPAFVEHWGTGGGFWNAMRIYPELDLGVAVMANTTSSYQHDTLMREAVATFAP